jgi:hypothetical protein
MTKFAKLPNGRYLATLNGRRFVLVCNRKTRSHSRKNEFGFGTHRVSRSVTWYDVVEWMDDDTTVRHTGIWAMPYRETPGSLKEAKALAVVIANEPLCRPLPEVEVS